MNHFDYFYRIRYADTDKMGISYYANYFVWFEAARTEYFRALGHPYTECEKKGFFLPVVETQAKYFSPTSYDDQIFVRTSVAELRKSSLRFEYQVFLNPEARLAASGFSVHVFVDRTMRPVRIPNEIREVVTVFSLLKK
ncbi:MAG: acyl-CoA thioesterase [Candidatus Omnitrophica bacterium]|nr:acyl-CoA thioesterase [Candidatus Omnitrophota bacterium]